MAGCKNTMTETCQHALMFKIVVTPNVLVDTTQCHRYLPVILHFTDLLSHSESQFTAPSLPCGPMGMISVVQWVGPGKAFS